jgi:sRNA-binding protein
MTESTIAAINRIRAEMIERWPDVFNVKKPVPLAIGINDSLLEAMPDITAVQLRRVLVNWCNRPYYLKTLTAGADRHGLEGMQGSVTEEQAGFAAERVEALNALLVEKAKAEKAKAKREAEKAEEAEKAKKARQAEVERKKAEKEAQKTKKAATAPPPPKPTPATPKPTGGPVIVVKKRGTLPLT